MMIYINKFLLICTLICSHFATFSQRNKVKADKYYKNLSYTKAAEYYETIDPKSNDVNRKLADCYLKTGKAEKAEKFMARLANDSNATADDLYNYFFVLRVNGKHEASEDWIRKYYALKTLDSRAKYYATDVNLHYKLKLDEGRFVIKNLNINSPAQDFGAAIYDDKLVFASTRPAFTVIKRIWNWNNLPFLNLYVAKRQADNELTDIKPFDKKFNAKYHEGAAVFSADGKWMAFTRDNYKDKSTDGIVKLEMYYTVLKDGKWQKEKPFPFNNKEYSVGHPALSEDGKTLYFASDMPGGFGGTDLYKSLLQDNGTWGAPQNLGTQINTEGNEMFPSIYNSGILFFSSDGLVGLGGLDVFAVQIKENNFGKVVNLGTPVNDDKDDFAFVLDTTGKSGYFSSNRLSGKGNDDIYTFRMLKPLQFEKTIKGVVKDKEGINIANASVKLFDASDNLIGTCVSGPEGVFSFEIDSAGDYALLGIKEDYLDNGTKVIVREEDDSKSTELILAKNPGYTLVALVSDKKTKLPLSAVKISGMDTDDQVIDFLTDSSGVYKVFLKGKRKGDKINYSFELKKEGYLSKSVSFLVELDKPGEIIVHDAMDLSLGRMELGTDIGKLINLNPIYFDVNKSNIRPDAALELDKVVKAMFEYPEMVVELGSHTDCRSSKAYNATLSDKRAKSSAAYIVSKGIPSERIYGKGYGESRLINNCACEGPVKSSCSEEDHQANRRTEFIIVKLKN